MNGESANASENLDQDVGQIRSEGKGRWSGIGKWQHVFVCVCVIVCVYSTCVATWHGEYERCQAGLCSSTGSVN